MSGKHARRFEESHAIRDPMVYKEIGRHGEFRDDLHQGLDLVFPANRIHFETGEAGMHGQHPDCAEQDKQGIGTVIQGFHDTVTL